MTFTKWEWDAARQKRYYYDPDLGVNVYEDDATTLLLEEETTQIEQVNDYNYVKQGYEVKLTTYLVQSLRAGTPDTGSCSS